MTRQLLAMRPMPDAIICANNHIALGCMTAIQEAGLRVPTDMGVMTFDDYPFSQMTTPELTVVDIKVRDMGEQAGRLLVDNIRHPNIQVQTFTTNPVLIVRGSTQRKKH